MPMRIRIGVKGLSLFMLTLIFALSMALSMVPIGIGIAMADGGGSGTTQTWTFTNQQEVIQVYLLKGSYVMTNTTLMNVYAITNWRDLVILTGPDGARVQPASAGESDHPYVTSVYELFYPPLTGSYNFTFPHPSGGSGNGSPLTYIFTLYVQPPYTITIVTPSGTTTDYVSVGSTYTLQAPTIAGKVFLRWVGEGAGSYTGNSSVATLTPQGNVTETAVYAGTYTIQVQAKDVNGTALMQPKSYTMVEGGSLQLSAPSFEYYTFKGWTGVGEGSYTGSQANVTITPKGDVTETATYSFDQWAATYDAYIAPFMAVLRPFIFDFAVMAFALIFIKVMAVDPIQGKHLSAVFALFGLLALLRFPFFALGPSSFTGGNHPTLDLGPFAGLYWHGSWIFGDWMTFPHQEVLTFLYNIPIHFALPVLILALVLLAKSRRALGEGTIQMGAPHNRMYYLIVGIYTLLAFLWLNGSMGTDPFLYLYVGFGFDPLHPLYLTSWTAFLLAGTFTMFALGLALPVLALPAYLLTRPPSVAPSPSSFSIHRPSRKVMAAMAGLGVTSLYFAPSLILPQVAIMSPYQLSIPILTGIMTAALLVWRRPWRLNGLFTAAFLASWTTIALAFLIGPNPMVTGMIPIFLFLGLPGIAIIYRQVQSKLWVGMAMLLSLFGFTQEIFFIGAAYYLIFKIQSVPSLRAPKVVRLPPKAVKEELEKELHREGKDEDEDKK